MLPPKNAPRPPVLFAAFAAAALCGLLGAAALAGVPQAGPVPEFAVAVLESLPKLDGRLDDQAWRQALCSTAFYPGGATSSVEVPSQGTSLYLGRFGQSLLIGVACRDLGKGIEGESVTVFLDPLHCHEFSYNFTLGSDGKARQDTWADPDWVIQPGNWESATARAEDGWSAEMRINLANLPYLRLHSQTAGAMVKRYLADKSHLVWALSKTEQGLMPWDEGWESFWACHLSNLNIPGLIGLIDEENEVLCAPLQPRLAALRRSVDRLLTDASLPVERGLKALSLVIWLEDLDPGRRQYVERVSRRGLSEREAALSRAELLSSLLAGESAGLDLDADPLARLAAVADGPARWETDVGRPIERFRGRGTLLGIGFAGLPLGAIDEEIARDAETLKERRESREKWPRAAGSELRHEQRGEFDVCLTRRPGGPERVLYVNRGLSIYEFTSAFPGGGTMLEDALFAGAPWDQPLVDRMLEKLAPAVKMEDAEGLLAFPLAEATLVVPPALEQSDPGLPDRVQALLGCGTVASSLPSVQSQVVVLGTRQHDAVLRDAGFPAAGGFDGTASGWVALRREDSRGTVAIWGRDAAGLEKAVTVLRDMRSALSGRDLLVGDLHAHSVLSDGSGSPLGVLLATIAAGMDFAALTDHSMVEGSLQMKDRCDRLNLGFTAIRGEEVLGQGFEVLALGINEWVRPQADIRKLAAEIHGQGGTALLCHPDEEAGRRLTQESDGLGLDGIDRQGMETAQYANNGDMIGRRPVVTEVTDAHRLTFGYPSRTLVFAQAASEQAVLQAIKDGYYVTLSPMGVGGPPRLVDVTLSLLDERNLVAGRWRKRVNARLAELSAAWRAGAF